MRVAWAASRLSNDLPVEGWHFALDPERMKMEVLEGLHACIEDYAMQARRHGDVSGDQSGDPEGSARKSSEKEVQRLDEIDPATPGPKKQKRRKMTPK